MSTSVVSEQKTVVISKTVVSNLKKGYTTFKGAAKKTLKDGAKLGVLMLGVKNQFHKGLKGMAEQTINTKFGQFITDDIGISKTHRNLLLQIVTFDGMLKMIESGEIESIREAQKYIVDANKGETDGNDGETDGKETDEKEPKSQGSKDFDKVISLLKQLDSLGINDKVVEKRILANASKVLGVEVKRESEKAA